MTPLEKRIEPKEFWLSEEEYAPLVFYSHEDFLNYYAEMLELEERTDIPTPVRLVEYSALAQAQSELRRLREALEFIANGCLVPPDGGSPKWPDDAIHAARQALNGGGGGEK